MENNQNKNFSIILLGIIFDPSTRKILIGKRKNDLHVPSLNWGFIGGIYEIGEEGVDKTLKRKIKESTGFDVKNLGTVFSNNDAVKKDFFKVYFLCEKFNGEENVGGDFEELKWVSPDEVEKYFSTKFNTRLKEYIINLK
ncbi:hypothetical protein CMI40_02340 [Candidatus Pacearchaeota archaeon]|jgi:ADP-ribose pyrophosphatase YjhB (NUDIX family)|nr:hypothetical protein [Candidatus Pacearchaeota archaeon]|tara:strand:+ start:8539 stop:8958 length:420 start_codon:yes stop_codon:yes gene_type:complete